MISMQFPNAVIDLLTVNQFLKKRSTACSFVSFINLCRITNNMHLFKDKKICKNWQSYWKKWNLSNGCHDIAHMLDLITNTGLLTGYEEVEYIPIKSAGNSENNYNISFWNPPNAIKRLGRQLKVEFPELKITPEERYQTMPHVYEICNLIESLLDKKIPVQINAMEHSRVCVGYNDNKLIFVDTCGDDIIVPGQYYAGLSVVDKWEIYCHVRDISYIKKEIIEID